MPLPNLSYMMSVGQLRHIQARYERAGRRGPDLAVGDFLSPSQRLGCLVRGRLLMARMRGKPFYNYVLARTRYYDSVFLDGISAGVKTILNIGCGSDTRAYRFAPTLAAHGVSVVECDQAEAIRNKERLARQLWAPSHVRYIAADLNQRGWPTIAEVLSGATAHPTLVMMEGVAAYVSPDAFTEFLAFLSSRLHPQSLLAYDYKIAGVEDEFGGSAAAQKPFRLPLDRAHVESFHASRGFALERFESGADLQRRLAAGSTPIFEEDCLLRLRVSPR